MVVSKVLPAESVVVATSGAVVTGVLEAPESPPVPDAVDVRTLRAPVEAASEAEAPPEARALSQ